VPAPDDPAVTLSRRRFLLGAAALSGAALLELTGCSGPAATTSPPRWVRVGVASLVPGEPTWIVLPAPPEPPEPVTPAPAATPPKVPAKGTGGAWLVAGADGSVTAFDPRCPHQACLYDWDGGRGRFTCRCHDGYFDIDGAVISGPPPRALDRLETRPAGEGVIEVAWLEVRG
jgi:Rieske Fe-S protein